MVSLPADPGHVKYKCIFSSRVSIPHMSTREYSMKAVRRKRKEIPGLVHVLCHISESVGPQHT